MRKKLLIVALLTVSCLFTGCDNIKHTIKYGSENLASEEYYYYFVTRIPNEDLPDEWHSCEYMSYYYHIDTNIIYFGKNNLNNSTATLNELKSEEFRNYSYNTETKEFVGVK